MATPSQAPQHAGERIKRREGGPTTREAIVQAGSRLMHVRGYLNTSLDDVLRESGVGKGNFYHYFKSKEELGYAILDRLVEAFLARTLEPCFAEAPGRPLQQIDCFLDRLLVAQRARNGVGGCPMGNLACELSDVHEGFRRRLASVFSTWRERFTGALRSGQAQGGLSAAARPEAVAQFVVASLEGAMLMTKLTKDVRVMEECIAELKRYLALYEPAS